MLNHVILVGRIVKIDEIEDKKITVTLAVNRYFKNVDGIYETDFIKCNLSGSLANNTKEYCEKGDLIGIRGSLRQGVESENLEIIADRVTFLSTGRKNNEEEEN